MDIKLLAAPLDPPVSLEVASRPASLAALNRQAPATRNSQFKDTSYYPDDEYVWTASLDEDGTFSFYPVPPNSSSNHSDGFQAAGHAAFEWSPHLLRNVVAQYALHASMPLPNSGSLVSIYV